MSIALVHSYKICYTVLRDGGRSEGRRIDSRYASLGLCRIACGLLIVRTSNADAESSQDTLVTVCSSASTTTVPHRSPTSSPKPGDAATPLRKVGCTTGSIRSSSSVSAASLPREVLHRVFCNLYTDDRVDIYNALQTCRNWMHVVVGEPRFWHTLRLPLHTLKFAKRLADFARFARLCTSQWLERLEVSHTSAEISEERLDILYDGCYLAVQLLQLCSRNLKTLHIRIQGKSLNHLQLLHMFLQPLASPVDEHGSALENIENLYIALPDVHGFQLGGNCFAWFQKLKTLQIVSASPLLETLTAPPKQPNPPPALVAWMRNRRAAVQQWGMEQLQSLSSVFEKERRRYSYWMEQYTLQEEQKPLQLFWSDLANPFDSEEQDIPLAPLPSPLTSIILRGCYLNQSLCFPASGFPALTSCTLENCKWGKGLYTFIGHSPALSALHIKSLRRDWQSAPPSQVQKALSPAASDPETIAIDFAGSPRSPVEDIHLSPSPSVRQTLSLRGGATGPHAPAESHRQPSSGLSDYDGSEFDWNDEDEVIGPGPSYPQDLRLPDIVEEDWLLVEQARLPEDACRPSEALYQICIRSPRNFGQVREMWSPYAWQELLRRRANFRQQELARMAQARTAATTAPEIINLTHLTHLTLSGEDTPLIWANIERDPVMTDDSTNTALHSVVSMPNLLCVDLSGNCNLDRRIIGPVLDERLAFKKDQPEVEFTDDEWDQMLDDFVKGKEPVPNEPTDDELLEAMDDEDYAYYTEKPWKMRQYRKDWRTQQGYYRDWEVDEDKLLDLVTGRDLPRPKPFALIILAAGSPKLSQLDLSYSNIGKDAFGTALPFLRSILNLNLAGTADLEDWQLKDLPATSPNLEQLDVRSSPGLSACGAAPLVEQYRDLSEGRVRLKVKVDDPALDVFDLRTLSRRAANFRAYKYLEFVDAVLDEDLEAWMAAQKEGKRISTKHTKSTRHSGSGSG